MSAKHYVDNSGAEIVQGFYLNLSNTEVIYVKEISRNTPRIEGCSGRLICTPKETLNWAKIDNPNNYIKLRQHEIDWMRKKLNPLEKFMVGYHTEEKEPTYSRQSE